VTGDSDECVACDNCALDQGFQAQLQLQGLGSSRDDDSDGGGSAVGSGGGVRSVDLTSEACCLVLLLRRLRRDERTVTLKVGTRR
jgi:hypothetical protein